MIYFHVPEDRELLAAVGEVALRHEHMNYALQMTIKSLADLTHAEAIAATEYESSKQLRERIKKLARKRLGEGQALLKLQAILSKCKKLTDQRNALVHGLWVNELDGEMQILDAGGNAQALPTTKQLHDLAKAIESHTNDMNIERLEGFLYVALKELPA